MPTFSGIGTAINHYTVEADDKDHALDLLLDMVKEDLPDADFYDVGDIILD